MKKLLTLTALGAILTAPASAVQKCVALDVNATATAEVYFDYNPEWSVTFPNIIVKGIAVCATTNKPSTSNTSLSIQYADSGNNSKCWCKMLSPAISRWIYTALDDPNGNCQKSCPKSCAHLVYRYPDRRKDFFTDLSI